MKKYILSAEEFSYVLNLMERINALFHADRTYDEFRKFQDENYLYISHAYYSIITSKLSDGLVEDLSEIDISPVDFLEDVARDAEILCKSDM